MAISEKDAQLIAKAIEQSQNTSEHAQHHQWLRDEIVHHIIAQYLGQAKQARTLLVWPST